jgi:tRNA (guanine37-N1)-methyltransferase
MRFDIITIFPNILDSYLEEGILARAVKKKIIEINFHNLRDYTIDKHRTTDDKPFGGGPGMIMMVEPIYKAIEAINAGKAGNQKGRKGHKAKIVLLSPRGKKFDQKMARKFSKLDQLILICGRYEGVDERVKKNIADEIVSVGDYVIAGGELPAMIIAEAVSRLISNVLGNKDSLESESHNSESLDFPQYTRPQNFKTKEGKIWKTPKVLISGNHAEIKKWREKKRAAGI